MSSLVLGDDALFVISTPLLNTVSAMPLTPAEADVCRLVLLGFSNAEIAQRRGTSQHTVANQLASLYGKLGVNARSELAALMVPELGCWRPTPAGERP